MKSYSQSDVALYVITAVMEGNCYELLSGSGNVENNSHCQKVYIRESVLLFNFLFALRSTHSYWCQWRIIYSESERDTWIKSGTGEFVTIGRPIKCLKISIIVSSIFVWFIQDLYLIYLSRSNPCSKAICNVYHLYMKMYHILIWFCSFLLDSFMQGDVFGFMW